jgi:hypothetical protein
MQVPDEPPKPNAAQESKQDVLQSIKSISMAELKSQKKELTRTSFSLSPMTPKEANTVIRALAGPESKLPSLQSIALDKPLRGGKLTTQVFLKALVQSPSSVCLSIRVLSLRKVNLRNADAKLVAALVSCCPSLCSLDLSGNALRSDALRIMKKYWGGRSSPSLRVLSLSDNPLAAGGLDELSSALAALPLSSLTQLDMSGCGLNHLGTGLSALQTFVDTLLGCDQESGELQSEDGVQQKSDVHSIAPLPELRMLNLRRNSLNSEAALQLGRLLEPGSPVKVCHVSQPWLLSLLTICCHAHSCGLWTCLITR